MSQPKNDVLSNYIGTWDVLTGEADAPFATGEYTAEWALGGQFVRTTGSVKTADGSNDFELLGMLTFDQQGGVYRMWSFFSYGLVAVGEGIWNETTRTMTETTPYGEITQTTKRYFSTDGVEEWTSVNTDPSGKVVSEMRGRNTRRAP